MSRPLRLEFPGALYHVTSRGDRKAAIFLDHIDRLTWLSLLGQICHEYNFLVYSFCQMTNHYHLLIETAEGNLKKGMQQLNGQYSQYFNRRHNQVGHVFQGRYHGTLVQRETYLLELSRYIVLNPVRAHLVASPDDWPWSSHQYVTGTLTAPDWLDIGAMLSSFATDPAAAILAYDQFVMAGIGMSSPLLKTRYQIILGDDDFISQLQRAEASADRTSAIPRTQRQALALSLKEYQRQHPGRDETIAQAYNSGAYTIEQIAAHFGLAIRTVSRTIKKQRMR